MSQMTNVYHNETVKRTLNVTNSLKLDDTVKDMKARHENWPGHLKRMDSNRPPRMALQYQPKGRRDIRRPGRRWKDQEHLEL